MGKKGERRKNLDETLGNEEQKESLPSNYLEEIKNKAFVGRSSKTFPFVEKSEYDDDCEILGNLCNLFTIKYFFDEYFKKELYAYREL